MPRVGSIIYVGIDVCIHSNVIKSHSDEMTRTGEFVLAGILMTLPKRVVSCSLFACTGASYDTIVDLLQV